MIPKNADDWKCLTCKFYDEAMQICRRSPPRADDSWPAVDGEDHCGEWYPNDPIGTPAEKLGWKGAP